MGTLVVTRTVKEPRFGNNDDYATIIEQHSSPHPLSLSLSLSLSQGASICVLGGAENIHANSFGRALFLRLSSWRRSRFSRFRRFLRLRLLPWRAFECGCGTSSHSSSDSLS
jgi:hypothetical protein